MNKVIDLRYHDGQKITSWRILECQWCKRPTLEEIVTSYLLEIDDANIGDMIAKSFQVTILYLGAHDTDDEVTEEDVPIILEFLEAILEYLYVAPAKIVAVQKRLKKTT